MKKITLTCLALLAMLLGTSCVETYPQHGGYSYRDHGRVDRHRNDWDRNHGSRDRDHDRYSHNDRRGNDWRSNDRRFSGPRSSDSRYIRTSTYYRH